MLEKNEIVTHSKTHQAHTITKIFLKVFLALCLAFSSSALSACYSSASKSNSNNIHNSNANNKSSNSNSNKSYNKSYNNTGSSSSGSSRTSSSSNSSTRSQTQIPEGAINWSEASNHVGEIVKIYGPVVSTKYSSSSNGQPTYIDIGESYPSNNGLSITIWGENRSAFSQAPETFYRGKTICVTGEIYIYRNACYIKVTSPDQISVL